MTVATAYGDIAAFIQKSLVSPEECRGDAQIVARALQTTSSLNDNHVALLAGEAFLLACGGVVDFKSPHEVVILHRRALALLRLGYAALGQAALFEILVQRPNFQPALRLAAHSFCRTDPRVALAWINRTPLKRLLKDPGLLFLHAEAMGALGRGDEALRTLQMVDQDQQVDDYWCAVANMRTSAASKLACLNQLFRAQGSSEVRLSGPGPFDLGRLVSPAKARASGPQVSVVMTTFNSASCVATALRSLLSQDYENLEVIVVDDASSDDTLRIVQETPPEGRGIKILRSTENVGTYACRNIGLMSSRAKYVAFHDSDDWAHPERIRRSVEMLEAHGQVAAHANWVRVEPSGRIVMKQPGRYIHRNPSITLNRLAVLETAGLFDRVRASGDSEYLHRLYGIFGRGAIGNDGRILSLAASHEDSLTGGGELVISEQGASLPRTIYTGRWVDDHISAEVHGVPAHARRHRRDDIVDDIPGLAVAPVPDARQPSLFEGDPLERLRLFWADRSSFRGDIGRLQRKISESPSAVVPATFWSEDSSPGSPLQGEAPSGFSEGARRSPFAASGARPAAAPEASVADHPRTR
jgi:hypothetical protein